MFDLFGSEMPLPAKFFIAFAAVLVLIGLTAWLVRRFGANRLGGGSSRGRQPRLAVIDAATVDARRRLVLIRRDNVEHLLMIGGPTDVLVEQNIVRAGAARDVTREPPRFTGPSEPAPRPAPPVENGWPLQPVSEPTPVPAPRPYRASATEEPWLAPEPGARPRPSDSSLTGLAAEPSTRLVPPAPPPVRSEPPARHSPPPVAAVAPEPTPQQDDRNLAEMAQQLEAALRRAPLPEGRPPVTDPLAAQVKPADTPARAPARDFKPRVEPKFDARPAPKAGAKTEPKIEPRLETRLEPSMSARPEPEPEPKLEAKPEPKLEAKPEPAPVPGKTVYDSLEDEMANLLGRQPGKT